MVKTDTERLVNKFIRLRINNGKTLQDVERNSQKICEATHENYHILHYQHISRMERKINKPSIDLLAKCFRALGYRLVAIPVDAFVYYRRKGENESHRLI